MKFSRDERKADLAEGDIGRKQSYLQRMISSKDDNAASREPIKAKLLYRMLPLVQ